MLPIIESIKIGNKSRKSKHSIIPNDLDSIRSTVLGKFYEGIVAKWLTENKKYDFLEGKPSVYWEDVQIHTKKHKYLENFKESLNKKKENNKHTNSDGLFKINQTFYLWEAKNWPKWNQGTFDFKEQIYKIFTQSPWIFANKVKHKGEEKQIGGFIFSWWNKFDGYDKFKTEISDMINKNFEIYFTSNIIQDCRENRYDWYINLLEEQQQNINQFFNELSGNVE